MLERRLLKSCAIPLESFPIVSSFCDCRSLLSNAVFMQGGTYTLSNPGPFGTLFTAPIINQPQVGILSMDAVKKRPHVVESADGDSIEIRPVGILAHSFDHRAIDGAYSAAYLQRLKTIIEDSNWESEF